MGQGVDLEYCFWVTDQFQLFRLLLVKLLLLHSGTVGGGQRSLQPLNFRLKTLLLLLHLFGPTLAGLQLQQHGVALALQVLGAASGRRHLLLQLRQLVAESNSLMFVLGCRG